MSSEKLQSIAFKWIDAFNNHNLEQLLALYDDDAEHYSPNLKIKNPETNGKLTGKNNLRIWWKEAFETLPSLNYRPVTFTANSDRIFMEYIRTVDGQNETLVAEVLVIKEDRIIQSRVYLS